MLTVKMEEMGEGIIAGVVGEQEASWLLLSILSLYINKRPLKRWIVL